MKNLFKNRTLCILACYIMVLFMASTVSIAQEKTDEDIKKKYVAIVGEYEFDLSDIGGGTVIINFHVEGGAIWADSGNG